VHRGLLARRDMVKQSVPMSATFSERFGWPQVLAGILLLLFLGQCSWLVAREYVTIGGLTGDELMRIQTGLTQWRGQAVAGTQSNKDTFYTPLARDRTRDDPFDPNHSPLWYLIASTPAAIFRVSPSSWSWLWLARAPYIVFGTLLGASLWYVSRRLYGNAGGFIALGLYCFSPGAIRSSSLWISSPDIGAVWGTFGAVFTAIAVSHTLYAPREVVLWNWRRTILLGVALTLAVGAHFGLVIVVPLLLAYMLYLAPERKTAASVILGTACVIAFCLLFASYFFHPRIFGEGLRHARFLDANLLALKMPGAYKQIGLEILASGPVLAILAPVALATYAAWPRARYFGNTAPLIAAALFVLLRILSPHDAGSVFSLAAVVFLFVFVAGIAADLLETRRRELFSSVIAGLVAANALWNLISLARVAR